MSKKISIIIFITLIGLVARVVYTTYLPPSLNWDEVSIGYNAFSLAKSGADEWGVSFPLIFRAFGDYKLPVYMYLLAPIVLGVGMNEIAIRSISVIAGTLTILLTYVLMRKMLAHKNISAFAAALAVAISPWTLFLSRVALEANVGLFFIVLGCTVWVYGRQKLSLLVFLISSFTYNSARVFVPLFLILIWIAGRKKPKISALITGILVISIIIYQLGMPTGQARYKWTTLIDAGAIGKINDLQTSTGQRWLYNKVTYFTFETFKNYLLNISPRFIFFSGGTNYQFNIPQTGLLYLINLPLLAIGIWGLMFKKDMKFKYIIILWILLAPIPSSITRDAPHTLRSIFLSVPIMCISAYGLSIIQKKYKTMHIFYLYAFLSLLGLTGYIAKWQQYRSEYSWAWQYGNKQLVQIIKENYDQVDKFVITKKYGEPHEFLLFYLQTPPRAYQQDKNLIRYAKSDWFWVDAFDKYIFVNDWEMEEYIKHLDTKYKYLIAASGESDVKDPNTQKILFLDGKVAYTIKKI